MYTKNIARRIRDQRILIDVSLELTYRCNLDCFFCYNDREKAGKPLSLEQYRVLLEDLARMQTLFLMLTGGEPMVHPHFFEIGRMARDFGFVTRVRTNGHSLSRRNCERLLDEVEPYMVDVSLHGASAGVHDRQTRVAGSFERLVSHIAIAREVGLRVGAVSTPTAWNEHQLEEMFALCDSLDVPLRFQGPVAPRDNGDPAPLAIQPAEASWERIAELQRQRQDRENEPERPVAAGETAMGEKPEPPATCGVGTTGVDIDPYGNVQACMHLQESAGNLHRQSIEEIWNDSPLFRRARRRAIDAARQFTDKPRKQLGAPLYCLAVEENLGKGHCGSGCGSREKEQPPQSSMLKVQLL
jgi:MoaA/NifB/PqqE/SkfB family radical SAM enzyme